MRSLKIISALLLLAGMSACSTTSDLGPGKTGKAFEVSGYTYDQVWDASVKSVKESTGTQKLEIEKNITLSKEDKEHGIIEGTTGMSMLSWGEVIGVFINPAHDAPTYKIDVESKSKMQTNLFSNNWEDEIIASIKQKLSQGKK